MKNRKEALPVLKDKILISLCLVLLQILSSCAHNFDHRNVTIYKGTIEQVLKVKIISKQDVQRLTIYASINRQKKQAILDGVGKFDKHIFTLEVKKGQYVFKDHLNNKEETGNIKEFKLVPLDENALFEKIDKTSAQPILIENKTENINVEINVIEQKELK